MTGPVTARMMVNSLIALKISTHLNSLDNRWGDSTSNKILYFIDADVVGLYLETPSKRAERSLSASPRAVQLDLFEEVNATPVHIPAEYATTEYILSQRLPAQRGEPVYLSDMHNREVEKIRAAILRRGQDPDLGPPPVEDDAEIQAALREFSSEIIAKSGAGYTDTEILELCERASSLTMQLFERAYETRNPQKYRSAETVLALARAKGKWTGARVIPAYRDVAESRSLVRVTEWCARLASEREGQPYVSEKSGLEIYNQLSEHVRDRILADACTLADLISLNRKLPEAQRAVLITGTTFVHRAYSIWYLEKAVAGPYLLRHAIQYLPLINLRAYSSAFGLNIDDKKSTATFRDIVSSLDVFLDPISLRPRFVEVLAKQIALGATSVRGSSSSEMSLLEKHLRWINTPALAEIVRIWRLAYGNSILITLPVVEGRRRHQDQILRAAIDQAGGDLLAAQNNIVANLEIDHMWSALAALAEDARHERQDMQERARGFDRVRSVVQLLISLGDNLDLRLERALSGPIDATIRDVRVLSGGQASESPDPQQIVFAIVLMMSLGGWAQAKRLAVHGSQAAAQEGKAELPTQAGGDEGIVIELRYLYGLAVRFDCLSIEEYRRAYRLLTPGDDQGLVLSPLRRGRALLERGTLQLAAALHLLAVERFQRAETWSHFSDDAELGEVAALLQGGRSDLKAAFATLKESDFAGDQAFARKRSRLMLQAAVNTVSGRVMQYIASVPSDTLDDEFAAFAEDYVHPFYKHSDELKPISLLNFEAIRTVRDRTAPFPGAKGRRLVELVASLGRAAPAYRRVIAPSDLDLVRLYSNFLSDPAVP
ncbi:MAG TPA: hypothetical protein VF702_13470 [Allosphingosinicella sp.]|jgi:hypothetical protein